MFTLLLFYFFESGKKWAEDIINMVRIIPCANKAKAPTIDYKQGRIIPFANKAKAPTID